MAFFFNSVGLSKNCLLIKDGNSLQGHSSKDGNDGDDEDGGGDDDDEDHDDDDDDDDDEDADDDDDDEAEGNDCHLFLVSSAVDFSPFLKEKMGLLVCDVMLLSSDSWIHRLVQWKEPDVRIRCMVV